MTTRRLLSVNIVTGLQPMRRKKDLIKSSFGFTPMAKTIKSSSTLQIEIPMPEDDDLNEHAERMFQAALGGKTPHEVLIEMSLADKANVEERAAAKAKNRERALKLLASLEKSED